ncbi:hypothetical protein EW145_g1194 [Phellinidium pouzarii]|uniref:Uncharacterized protein n=1 Tax=Phellinidium pouzarii TaxID=167371 RepID=A0A4S4LFE7_9AGAM|nr:hypothetical protein EW145_g1194 [Phellinidium pouzarii]
MPAVKPLSARMPPIDTKESVTMSYLCYAFIAQLLASCGLILSVLAPIMIRHPLPEFIETKASRYRLLTPRASPPKAPVEAASEVASAAPVMQRSPSAHRRHTLHSVSSNPFDARNHVQKARRATLSTLRSFSTPARRPFLMRATTHLQPQAIPSRISSVGSNAGTEDASSSKDSEKNAAPLLQRAASVIAPIQRARQAVRRSFSLAQAPILFDGAPLVSETFIEEHTLFQSSASTPSDDQCVGASTPTQSVDIQCTLSPTLDDAPTKPLTFLKAARIRTQTVLRKTRVYTRKREKSAFGRVDTVDRP